MTCEHARTQPQYTTASYKGIREGTRATQTTHLFPHHFGNACSAAAFSVKTLRYWKQITETTALENQAKLSRLQRVQSHICILSHGRNQLCLWLWLWLNYGSKAQHHIMT